MLSVGRPSTSTGPGYSVPASAPQTSSGQGSGSAAVISTPGIQDMQIQSGQDGVATPKKELPSMFDVPAGFRKRSPDRNRQIKRANTSSLIQPSTPSSTSPPTSLDAPSQGVFRAATDCWRPPTPPNHLLKEPAADPPKTRNPFSRNNTSFFGKLKRTGSNTKVFESSGNITSNPRDDQPLFDASRPVSATNRRPSIPLSRSSRNTPDTSAAHTPPSPCSVSSKVSEEQEDDSLKRISTTGGQLHSRSGSAIARASSHQPSVAWNMPTATSPRQPSPEFIRRRSQSSEHIPRRAQKVAERADRDDPKAQELLPTFSQHAAQGSGLKARRLSRSLPSEFQVSFCELNDAYKSTKVFARGKKLGKGATSEVTIMAVKGSKDELVAVKEFRGKETDEGAEDYVKKVKSEFTIAKSLHHPNIVETLRLCTHSGRWNHVMEYCELGDLYHLVEKGLFKTHYKALDRMCFFKQILRAVDYLHSHGIAHRDIKLENLLLTSGGTIKLTDFGVSEVFCGEHPGMKSAAGECGKKMGEVRHCPPGLCGSLPYIAPEVLKRDADYDPRPLDVWSTAITYITMQYAGPPWHSAKLDQPKYATFVEGWDKWLAEHPDGVIRNEDGGWPRCGSLFANIDPPPLKRLILKMLHPDPEKRITVREILGTSFLKGTECCSPESYDPKVCGAFDASKGMKGMSKANVLPKHDHLPPKEHRTPAMLRHRFDMGDGYNDGIRMRVV